MKTLLLMRHAKSSWKDQTLKDRDRPLSKRGVKNAVYMGSIFLEYELIPQLVLSSSVKRARQTAELVLEACRYPGTVIYLDTLFLAEAEVILDALRLLPDDMERVLVIGHNPGLVSLLQMLTQQIIPLPTAGVAYISLSIDTWRSLSFESTAELVEVWQPKDTK